MRTSQKDLRELANTAHPISRRITPARIRTLARVAFASVLLLTILYLTDARWLPLIYAFLDVSQPPQPADFLVMLGGGSERADKVVALYQEGYAPYVICSGGHPTVDDDLNTLKKGGIPVGKIIINDHATSTWDEAQQVMRILQMKKARSALIVTSAWHTRRAQATYQKFNSGVPIPLIFVPSEPAPEANGWWKYWWIRNPILMEYIKLVDYFFRIPI